MTQKRGLGKGLDALLGDLNASALPLNNTQPDVPVDDIPLLTSVADASLVDISVTKIRPGRFQPRGDITPETIEELASSIRAQGVIQPIVIRPIGGGEHEIIAGERRWRAAMQAGFTQIPALIRDLPDESALAMALIENIQREDLNPLEEAVALRRLQEEFSLSQQEVAAAVGKSRSAVANFLRLLQLEASVQGLLARRDLEMGHARALLGLPSNQQQGVAELIVQKGLSVRQTERFVRDLKEKKAPVVKPQDPNIASLEERLSTRLGTLVRVQHHGSGKGKLVVCYNSLEELDGILVHLLSGS